MSEAWQVVILAGDGDWEGAAWGAGPTREAATDAAVTQVREAITAGYEEDGDSGPLRAIAYRNPVTADVKGKAWDFEIIGYDERLEFQILVWMDRVEVVGG